MFCQYAVQSGTRIVWSVLTYTMTFILNDTYTLDMRYVAGEVEDFKTESSVIKVHININ